MTEKTQETEARSGTPWPDGPWHVEAEPDPEPYDEAVLYVVHPGTACTATAVCEIKPDGSKDAKAVAHLLSAAPALYDALQDAVDCGMVPASSAKDGGANRHSRQVLVADRIRSALSLARGEQA